MGFRPFSYEFKFDAMKRESKKWMLNAHGH